jgi:hypothetical protein
MVVVVEKHGMQLTADYNYLTTDAPSLICSQVYETKSGKQLIVPIFYVSIYFKKKIFYVSMLESFEKL